MGFTIIPLMLFYVKYNDRPKQTEHKRVEHIATPKQGEKHKKMRVIS